jgi:hypothetical protein
MKFYVYILLDDRIIGDYGNPYLSEIKHKPFYVGKGSYQTKNKTYRHLIHYKDSKLKCENDVNPNKCRTIRLLKEQGYNPNFSIVFESDDENKVLEVERELILFYGKKIDGGILTNITDGGVGGNLFDCVDGLKERLRKINSDRWSGVNNPNYGRKKEDTFSFNYKLKNGSHWNSGRTMSDEHKNMLKINRYDNLPYVEMINPITGEIMDRIKTIDAIKKYKLNPTRFYKCLKEGGIHKGYGWKYEGRELVLLKSLREDYEKPKSERKKPKKVYFKFDINDNIEYEYDSVKEAAKQTNYCEVVVRRKCGKNLKTKNVFRYENSDYKIELTGDGKVPVLRIDELGNKVIFNSITEAAKSVINGNPATIVAVCKGKRKKHKGYKFQYLN